MALAILLNPVILSDTPRRRSGVESKDPEIASFNIPPQGVLTRKSICLFLLANAAVALELATDSAVAPALSKDTSARDFAVPSKRSKSLKTQLSLPQPFQHSGPRQTNKLFPCNPSRQTPPYPRLFPHPDFPSGLAAAARTRH